MAVTSTNVNVSLTPEVDRFVSRRSSAIQSNINTVETSTETLDLDIDELNGTQQEPVVNIDYEEYVTISERANRALGSIYNYTLNGNSKYEGIKKLDEQVTEALDIIEKDPNSPEKDRLIKKFSAFGVEDYEGLLFFKQYLDGSVVDLKISVVQTQEREALAKYDGLGFTTDFKDYEISFNSSDLETIEKESNLKDNARGEDMNGVFIGKQFDYIEYHKKHPEISQVEFVMMLESKYPGERYSIKGIGTVDEIKDLIAGSVENPELLKLYAYYGDQGSEAFKKFRKDNMNRINDLRGKVQAKKVVEDLQKADSSSKVAAILNNTEMAFYSLEQAAVEYGMGYTQHILDFLDMLNPNLNYGSVKGFDEYKYGYIQMAISDMETKAALGLVEKDKNGNYVSTNPNSIIDFDIDLAGSEKMAQVYKTSKVIWKLLIMMLLRKAMGKDESIKVLGQDVKFMNIIQSIVSGGEKERSLRLSGLSADKATIGGLYQTFSDLLMNKFLGGIQMFGDVKVNSLKSYIKAAFKEGLKSPAKLIADSVFEWTFLGVEPPQTEEEFLDYIKKVKEKSIQGIILALISNLGWKSESNIDATTKEVAKQTDDVVEEVSNTQGEIAKEVSKKIVSENTNEIVDGTKDMAHDTSEGVKYIIKNVPKFFTKDWDEEIYRLKLCNLVIKSVALEARPDEYNNNMILEQINVPSN